MTDLITDIDGAATVRNPLTDERVPAARFAGSAHRDLLADVIREAGPIPTARVSSAQACGRARDYAYWGAVRYQIRLDRRGRATNVALERAGSDRRSGDLAERDLAELCAAEGRIVCETIGALSELDARAVLVALGEAVS